MTSEQIAELRRLHNGVIAQDTAWAQAHGVPIYPENVAFMIACNNSLRRLLDEREALLEALKHATEAIAGEWGDSSADDLRAVIAKAEAP